MGRKPKVSEDEMEIDGLQLVEKQDNGKLITESSGVVEEKTDDVPDQDSPEWDAYVMNQFLPEELIDGRPRVNGLRRVTRKLLGRIVYSHAEVVQVPNIDNGMRAVVTHEIRVAQPEFGFTVISFKEVGDSHKANTDDDFLRFQVPLASTRAEVRALRKALSLKTAAAEEMTKKEAEPPEDTDYGMIKPSQIQMIDMLCRRNGIDVNKFIAAGEVKYDDIEHVTFNKACLMVDTLNKFQRDQSKIPPNIKVSQ